MMNFKLITKAMIATCFVTGLTVMNSATGSEFNYSKRPAYSNYSSYQPDTSRYGSSSRNYLADYRTYDSLDYANNKSDYRGTGLNCPNGQCHLRGNRRCGTPNDNFGDSYDRQRSLPRRNDFSNPPTPPRYDNSDASYRPRDSRYRDSLSRYDHELNRYPSSNDRDSYSRYDSLNRDRYRSDRNHRFEDNFYNRSRDNRYRPDRLSSRESRDRLTPVSYEARKPPVSNQGQSPFYN